MVSGLVGVIIRTGTLLPRTRPLDRNVPIGLVADCDKSIAPGKDTIYNYPSSVAQESGRKSRVWWTSQNFWVIVVEKVGLDAYTIGRMLRK